MSDPRPITKKFKSGLHTATMPFSGICTVYAWGGGGGAGGADARTVGGAGTPGLFNSTSFSFVKNDVIEVAVGSGGLGGASNSGSAPGGSGGSSRTNLESNTTKSFNGGNGSASGPTPYSGGGGGGGGATVVLKNNSLVLAAAGGGGGGGAGNDGNNSAAYTRRTASNLNNATNAGGTDYRGESAQKKTGDGGGAGGGGGGYPGGQGGAVNPGDTSGYAGQSGGNYPAGDSFYQSESLVPVSASAWSSFMNQYAVWVHQNSSVGTFTIYRTIDIQSSGTYKINSCVDNTSSIYIDDTLIGTSTVFSKQPTPIDFTLTRGVHRIKIVANNSGGPGGIAMTIVDPDGQIVWDTRTYRDIDPSGKDSRHYEDDVARGGIPNGGNGRDGYAVLVFEPYANQVAASAVKVVGNWRQITQGYVKVSGDWRPISDAYVKIRGVWRKIRSTGDVTNVAFSSQTLNYGRVDRTYS